MNWEENPRTRPSAASSVEELCAMDTGAAASVASSAERDRVFVLRRPAE